MAGRLMHHASMLLAAACMAAAPMAGAQAMRDPTRPPAASTGSVVGRTEPSGWILQSVLISPERRYAIINGEVVAIGGSVAGAELVAVAAERVTLRTQGGLRVVHLFPDVTRLGAANGSTDWTKHMQAPEAEQDTKVKTPGSRGKKK